MKISGIFPLGSRSNRFPPAAYALNEICRSKRDTPRVSIELFLPGAGNSTFVTPGVSGPMSSIDHRRRIWPVPVDPIPGPSAAGGFVIPGPPEVIPRISGRHPPAADAAAADAADGNDAPLVEPLRKRSVLLRRPARRKTKLKCTFGPTETHTKAPVIPGTARYLRRIVTSAGKTRGVFSYGFKCYCPGSFTGICTVRRMKIAYNYFYDAFDIRTCDNPTTDRAGSALNFITSNLSIFNFFSELLKIFSTDHISIRFRLFSLKNQGQLLTNHR